MKLDGLTAAVTGGGSGMGKATAEALAEAGMRVLVLDRDGPAAEATAAAIDGRSAALDVTDASAVDAALQEVVEDFGPLRLVVNCAGIATAGRIVGREGPHDLDAFRRTIEVNLIGTFNVLRLAAARMAGNEPMPDADGERGVIVNTASIAAFEGQVGQAAYAASKGGVAALTLPAARELARHAIRVVTVAPGLIGTPMLGGMDDKVRESLEAQTVFPRRLGRPEEFARLVREIAGNPLINGETIRLDGAVRLAAK
ncbi:MAG: SDR family NAD(P)-dependent oxidoreductase [Azospirillaceae bacterium]